MISINNYCIVAEQTILMFILNPGQDFDSIYLFSLFPFLLTWHPSFSDTYFSIISLTFAQVC